MEFWLHSLYLPLLTFAAGLALLTVGFTLRMRELPGAKLLAMLMAGVTLWCIGCIIELMFDTLPGKLLACKIEYLGIATVPLIWFFFILQYLQRDGWLTHFRKLLFWVIPAITALLIWTNEYHHLMYRSGTLDLDGYPPYWHIIYGAWFWVHISYSWALVVIALILIFTSLRQMAPFYRLQAVVLVLIAFVPLIVNVIYVLRLGPFPWLDLTPVAFAFSGASILLALRYFHLLDLSPIARNAIFENMIDGVIVLDGRERIIDTNPAMRAILRADTRLLYGGNARDCFAAWLPGDIFQQDNGIFTVQIAQNGEESLWFDLRVSALPRRRGWLLVLRDITDRHLLQERLNAMAYYDYLTGLPNRALANDHLVKELARAKRHQTRVAVLYVDIDGFKTVNDTFGHAAGDLLLQEIARRLLGCVRETDTVARMGGDEFILVVSNLTNPNFAKITAMRIITAFAEPIQLESLSASVTVSIGIAVTPDDGMEADLLIRRADHAMYQVKQHGKNAFLFFTDRANSSPAVPSA